MSSTYGWLTESALAIERPVPLRGVSQQSLVLLSSIVRKQQESQQKQLEQQRQHFAEAAKAGKVFTHDAQCDRRWTRPNPKPLDWAERQLALRNDAVDLRIAADAAEESRSFRNFCSVESHLENKSKLYDRMVGGLPQTHSAFSLLRLRQKRRNLRKSQLIGSSHDVAAGTPGPQLSTEALAELLNLPDGSQSSANEMQIEQQQATRLAFLQARLNLYRHVLGREP